MTCPIIDDEPRDARGRPVRDPAPVFEEHEPAGACGCGHLDEDHHGPRCLVAGCTCGRWAVRRGAR